MSSLSTEPILITKGDAFNVPSVSNITNMMSCCHSKRDVSPLDIAKELGHETIVSMVTEALTCEFSTLSTKLMDWDNINIPILLCFCLSTCLFKHLSNEVYWIM